MAKPALVYSTSGRSGKAAVPRPVWHIAIFDPRNGCVATCCCGRMEPSRTARYEDARDAYDRHASEAGS